jgi:hypothetical protein
LQMGWNKNWLFHAIDNEWTSIFKSEHNSTQPLFCTSSFSLFQHGSLIYGWFCAGTLKDGSSNTFIISIDSWMMLRPFIGIIYFSFIIIEPMADNIVTYAWMKLNTGIFLHKAHHSLVVVVTSCFFF